MAAGFKKILIEGDAAALSTNAPADVGTTASAGEGTAASKDDHVHDIASGAIDNANKFAASVVDSTALAASAVIAGKISASAVTATCITGSAVGAAQINAGAKDIALAQLILTPTADACGTAEGTLWYDSDDDHLYIYTGG
jgi:hypothetical protein